MLPATSRRVPEHTAAHANEWIHEQSRENVARYAQQGPEAIERRLAELNEEWDVERILQTNFAIVALAGIALGEKVDRRWHLFSAVAAGFMVQHALQGWCPPVPIFRRLGFRTQAEIDREKYALKALRGDFQHVSHESDDQGSEQALRAVRS